MAKGKLKIHTENILPIIKKWLYSDRDIYVRELVSNACDAIHKRKTIARDESLSFDESAMKIEIKVDKEAKTISFIDTGLGMNADEVKTYIAQLAFSGAEEFASKYKDSKEGDGVIGHFGLGFYSAYMVSKNVEIDTLTYRDGGEAVSWECDGGVDYKIGKGRRTEVGTTITLHIADDSSEFLEEERLKEILTRYCSFLPFPIFLNETRINEKEPLWLKSPSECTEEEYLEFYKALYPFEPEPLFWVHLNVDYPFSVRGILYFPKITPRFDWNRNEIKLFCNRVFVSQDCKELIPEHFKSLRGAIDSPDIPLNVSRSYLQMDRTVRQLATHVSKKVADRLSALMREDKKTFTEKWSDMELTVKLGCIQDAKFYERAKDLLIWKNLNDEWLTTDEYLEKQKGEKIFYTTEGKHQSQVLNLYKEKGIEVLIANGHLDAALMNHLESKMEKVKFQRIDGAVDDALLCDNEKESSEELSTFFKEQLGDVETEAKPLASENIPAMVVMSEEMRRMRDYMSLSGQELPEAMTSKCTFVVNSKNPLIKSIFGLKSEDPELAKEITQHLYSLSLLSQKELKPKDLGGFVEGSSKLMEKLLARQKQTESI